jgi:nucleotide-binding universal stress UspA family protein
MSYRTIVVGTDGSESSLRAVDRAAAIAAQEKAKLVIASAHLDTSEKGGWSRPPSPDRLIDGRAADNLGGAAYRMHGSASVYAILQDARERAKAAGAHDIEEQAIVGAPVSALLHLAAVFWAPCPTPLPAKPKSTSSSSTPSDSLKRHLSKREAAKSVGGLNIRRQIMPMPSNISRTAAWLVSVQSTKVKAPLLLAR